MGLARDGSGGTALARGEAIRHSEQGRLIQLSNRNSASGGFRTNLGLVNTTSEATRIEVELHTADGTRLGAISVDLPAYGYRQLDRVFNGVTAGEVIDGYAIVRTPTVNGAFFAYASVIDNLTGDPVIPASGPFPDATWPPNPDFTLTSGSSSSSRYIAFRRCRMPSRRCMALCRRA